MLVCSIIYAFNETVVSFSVLLILIYVLSFVIPLVLNVTSLKVCDFCKGVVYSIFLSPTYVNIFTIYAICNIHDVSWGSRPSQVSAAILKAQAKKNVSYKNYRSNFMIFWMLCNAAVAYTVVTLSRKGETTIIFITAVFLSSIIVIKLIFAILHMCTSKFDRLRTRSISSTIKRKKDNKIHTDTNEGLSK